LPDTAPAAAGPQLFEPVVVGRVAGHEVTGFVYNGRTYYGPYLHTPQIPTQVQDIVGSGELWGKTPRTGFGGLEAEVKAYFRPGEPVPPKTIEFYTPVAPSNFSPARMGGPRWAEGAPGVRSFSSGGVDWAKIEIMPIRVGPSGGTP